jgi:hypothetical protein
VLSLIKQQEISEMSNANTLTQAQFATFYKTLNAESMTPKRQTQTAKEKTERRRLLEHQKELAEIEKEFLL